MDIDIAGFERSGFLIVRDLWKAGELDELQSELTALGQLIVGPEFSVHDAQAYSMSAEQQSLRRKQKRATGVDSMDHPGLLW